MPQFDFYFSRLTQTGSVTHQIIICGLKSSRKIALSLYFSNFLVFSSFCERLFHPDILLLRFLMLIRCNCRFLVKFDSMKLSIGPDLNWSKKLMYLFCFKRYIEFCSVYYSVIGGAFSSLGKKSILNARKAGILAKRQIAIAKSVDDSVSESRCWIYYAESLIQQNRFSKAKKIIDTQSKFAVNSKDSIVIFIIMLVAIDL
jgi:hypothetical protein